jgi:hypothetical protein
MGPRVIGDAVDAAVARGASLFRRSALPARIRGGIRIIGGRLGYATATGATEQDCLQALDAAQAGLRLTERVGAGTR